MKEESRQGIPFFSYAAGETPHFDFSRGSAPLPPPPDPADPSAAPNDGLFEPADKFGGWRTADGGGMPPPGLVELLIKQHQEQLDKAEQRERSSGLDRQTVDRDVTEQKRR